MSGHNKWSQIKNKKGAEDARKSKIFSKFSRLITLESKKSNGSENAPGLRAVIARARAENMPGNIIERAIKKCGDKEARTLEEITYEAYGPRGSALVVECLTDNKNRTLSEVRQILLTHEASLAEKGAALWAFDKKDTAWVPKTKISLSEEGSLKLKQLIEELEEDDDVQKVYTNCKL